MSDFLPIIILAVVLFVIGLGAAVIVARFYRKVLQGQALIVNTMKSEPLVTFTGATVFPIIHRAEVMDISVKTIEIDRRGKEGLICQDNIRADINVTFFVRVNKTRDDVLKVAQSIGCARASDHETLRELFSAKFSEALKTVGKHFDFVDLYTKREEFKDRIIQVIGTDLNGYVLDDCAIDFLEQTPVESLDKDNIMDAEGIR
ncbi:MAG: SPFH domain-containing protein, partial [Polyangiaceae bacterium]|nr:SPFH domain-containing protein [Polyangiaceae bacterium]